MGKATPHRVLWVAEKMYYVCRFARSLEDATGPVLVRIDQYRAAMERRQPDDWQAGIVTFCRILLFPASLGERCKLPQRVRAEPGRQTSFDESKPPSEAFWAHIVRISCLLLKTFTSLNGNA